MTLKTKPRRRRLIPLFAAAATLALTACADAPPQDHGGRYGGDREGRGEDGRPGGGPGGGHVARLPNIFISPAGKPYRARPDEPYPVAVWFAEADVNHDGKLTRDEMRADAAAFFRTLDANHDGVIDGVEVQTYEQTVAPEILPRIEGLHAGEGFDPNLDLADQRNTERPGAPDGGGSGRGRRGYQPSQPRQPKGETGAQGAAVYSLINQPEPVAAADADFDGKVTLAEFEAAADRHFDILDTKQLGYLTLAGLPKTPIQEAIEQAAKRRAAERSGERVTVDRPEF